MGEALSIDHHLDDHGGGTGKYWIVFLCLCVLTSASFFTVSSAWPFRATPTIGWAFMIAVSCTKAMLVISCFMHLWWEANWKYVLTIPAALMSVFLVLMLVPDIGLRERTFSREHQQFASEAEPVGAGHGATDQGHLPHAEGNSPGHAQGH